MGFRDYLWSAFNARPLGMPIPPNWIALTAIGLLGFFVHPGLLLVGAGLEIGYLVWLTSNQRFRNLVDAQQPQIAAPDRRQALLAQLTPQARAQHEALEDRCRDILALNRDGEALLQQQDEQLRQLCWLHLRLLAARSSVQTVADTGIEGRHVLELKLRDLQRRRIQISEDTRDLATSIDGQLAILSTRLNQFDEAVDRLAYLDAEIERLRQQAELIREQSLLAVGGADSSSLSASIQGLGDSLVTTNRWMRDQRLTGDLSWEDAPPLPMSGPAKARQRAQA